MYAAAVLTTSCGLRTRSSARVPPRSHRSVQSEVVLVGEQAPNRQRPVMNLHLPRDPSFNRGAVVDLFLAKEPLLIGPRSRLREERRQRHESGEVMAGGRETFASDELVVFPPTISMSTPFETTELQLLKLSRHYASLSPSTPSLIPSPPFPSSEALSRPATQSWLAEQLLAAPRSSQKDLEGEAGAENDGIGAGAWKKVFWRRVVKGIEEGFELRRDRGESVEDEVGV